MNNTNLQLVNMVSGNLSNSTTFFYCALKIEL